jgi:CBS domain-containing membrane protein
MMTAADLMTPDPLFVTETTSLDRVRDRMEVARVRHMPVVRGNRLVGILSHRDVLSAQLSRLVDHDRSLSRELLATVPVAEVMRPDVVTVHPDTPLLTVVQTLLDRKIDCVPVVRDGALVGIVTSSDFLKLTRSLLQAAHASAPDDDYGA